jgi:hypothetical protein
VSHGPDHSRGKEELYLSNFLATAPEVPKLPIPKFQNELKPKLLQFKYVFKNPVLRVALPSQLLPMFQATN